MPPSAAPRLHVLLARDSANAVVIRRGPSRHTAVIGWNRDRDIFEVGQWLCGRIYERRCDLSPDGRHLIYFAMNGRWSSRAKGAWTAISRAPYLKALALFAKGDCWNGGGLFQGARDYWLNDGCGHQVLEDAARLRRVKAHPWTESYGGECPGVYYIRLQRDGWSLKDTTPDGYGGQISRFDKRINDRWDLRKYAHASAHHPIDKGVYYDTHELFHRATARAQSRPGWEWADIDRGRLVWASEGRLYAGRVLARGLVGEKLLHDFSDMRFERLTAPY